MSEAVAARRFERISNSAVLPWAAATIAFAILFARPIQGTVTLWLTSPDAGHGLLLAPVAVWLAWRSGLRADVGAQRVLGSILLIAAVILRYLSGMAAELFTMRLSALGAIFALVIFGWGFRQLLRWWLPAVLLLLSIPLPEVLIGTLALPLQLEASKMGAAMLAWRHVPVELAGNVITIPGNRLFVTEACSGLRSLSALLALGFLIGGIWLRTGWARAILVIAAVPIAMLLNAVRIFLTGFSIHFIDPRLGEGLMHYTEGWAMFVGAFVLLGGMAWVMVQAEASIRTRPAS